MKLIGMLREMYDITIGPFLRKVDSHFKLTTREKMVVLNLIVMFKSYLATGTIFTWDVLTDILVVDLVAYWILLSVRNFSDLQKDIVLNNYTSLSEIDKKYLDLKNENELSFIRRDGGALEKSFYNSLELLFEDNKLKVQNENEKWIHLNLSNTNESFKGIESREVSAKKFIKALSSQLDVVAGAYYMVDNNNLILKGSFNFNDIELSNTYSLEDSLPLVDALSEKNISIHDIKSDSSYVDKVIIKDKVNSVIYCPVKAEGYMLGIIVIASLSSKDNLILSDINSREYLLLNKTIDSFSTHMIAVNSIKKLEDSEEKIISLYDDINSRDNEIKQLENIGNIDSYLEASIDNELFASCLIDNDSIVLYQNNNLQELVGKSLVGKNLFTIFNDKENFISGPDWISSFIGDSTIEDLIDIDSDTKISVNVFGDEVIMNIGIIDKGNERFIVNFYKGDGYDIFNFKYKREFTFIVFMYG